MASFFTSAEISLGVKLLEIIFIVMGLLCLNTAQKNLRDKENKSPVGTAIFWSALGVVLCIGRWIPAQFSGLLVIIMTLPPILRKVKTGKKNDIPSAYTSKQSDKLGVKIFLPALSIGGCAIIFALFTKLGALVGIGAGVLIAIALLFFFDNNNKPQVFLSDCSRLLETVGPLSMLPMLLASLGAIFTAAGVGDVVSKLVGAIVPQGNVIIGIIVYAVGMAIFTMVMGNAFAAITVMTAGIGYPFVLAYGADPTLIGMIALTSGYCGTLMTPMAANFNIVPVAMLDMKDKYGVIKNQYYVAIPLLIFQIVYMIMFR